MAIDRPDGYGTDALATAMAAVDNVRRGGSIEDLPGR